MTKEQITFHWKNFFRPTPKNLEVIATGLRRILAVVAGTTIVLEANEWVTLGVIVLGAILDEMKNFFAYAGGQQEQVVVTYPAEIADKVDVEVKEKD